MRATRWFLAMLGLVVAAGIGLATVRLIGIGPRGWVLLGLPVALTDAEAATALTFGFLLPGFGCAIACDRGRRPVLMRLGMKCSVIGAVGVGIMTVDDQEFGPISWATAMIWPFSLSVFAALSGLTLLIPQRAAWWRKLRRGTLVLAAATGLFLCMGVSTQPLLRRSSLPLFNLGIGSWTIPVLLATIAAAFTVLPAHRPSSRRLLDAAIRLSWVLAVMGFAAALLLKIAGMRPPMEYVEGFGWWAWSAHQDFVHSTGMVLLLFTGAFLIATLLAAFHQGSAAPTPPADRRSYWLCCPRCAREQTALTGVHHCERCGLRVEVMMS